MYIGTVLLWGTRCYHAAMPILVLAIYAGTLVAVALAIAAAVPLFWFARGAPFVPSSRARIRCMVALADIRPGQRAADIGAGDGRIVIALARAGAIATGFEINPLLVWFARLRIRLAGLGNRATVNRSNFWHQSFAPFDIVTVYGLPSIMPDLEVKLRRELKPGSRVVSNAFPFPHWQPLKTEGTVFLYTQV
ncbi:hypothetical protein C4552_03845 [Candidatus Parcubacteria bacterium]|nr:MAG: hypothetical protein C4552_03845 [Candidatus Parcubacteria bacterium]